ncbi:hypothetical protein LSTR_LSTR004670 [Laodelphax striatellus]|uniref:Uncharacterized protein n=1 Tax=Laodelphax striatellus TaxID=195883 RepID=A0A482WUM7_LAOST|nr:hypothetical protein LSTR_LSTR004670 [Laodelphax striatellus]
MTLNYDILLASTFVEQILIVFSRDHTNEFDKQTTNLKVIHYNSLHATEVLRKAWSIMNANEMSSNLILYLSSKRANYNRQQSCKKREGNKLLMVEKNNSKLFPGLRASRLKSNGIEILDINDSIGHVHH